MIRTRTPCGPTAAATPRGVTRGAGAAATTTSPAGARAARPAPTTERSCVMSRTDRAADAVELALMAGMGALAGAASFTHVRDLAKHHGQGGWIAWAVAVSIELMAVTAALEIRRTRRTGCIYRAP